MIKRLILFSLLLLLIGCSEKTVEEQCIPHGIFYYGYYDINGCFAEFAAEKNNISICYSNFFQKEYADNAKCLSYFARKNISLCETATGLDSVDECYYIVAINTSNQNICEIVQDKSFVYYTECLGIIAVKNKNISICHGVSSCEEYYGAVLNSSGLIK